MDNIKIPEHVAIILDGNGRWAKKRLMPRSYGHKNGAENVVDIALHAKNIGVKHLTLYAFSTENWKRPEEEVNYLMDLMIKFINEKLKRLMEEDCRLNFLGDLEKLPEKTKKACIDAHEKTINNKSLDVNIAINYGGRDEINNAIRNIIKDGIKEDEINEDLFRSYLYTKDMKDPDLLIRPGGELRISNFLIYQLAYSEFYFTDTLWPDFNEDEFDKAIISYTKRDRRYGGVNEPS